MSWFREIDWFDVFAYGLCAIIVIVFLGFIIWYVTLPTIASEGVIIDKHIAPGHTSYITTHVGKTVMTSPIYFPEQPTLVVRRTDGTIAKLTVHDEIYYSRKIGDRVSFKEKDYR